MPNETTVLFVDDDPLIAMTGVDLVQELGYRVHEANSGDEALKLLSLEPVDVLITDLSMPGMNGIDLARAALSVIPALKVIVATGYATLPAGHGLDLVKVAKPYTKEDLEAAITDVLASV